MLIEIYTGITIIIVMLSSLALLFVFNKNKLLNLYAILSVIAASVSISIAFPFILGVFLDNSGNSSGALLGINVFWAFTFAILMYIVLVFISAIIISMFISQEKAEKILDGIKKYSPGKFFRRVGGSISDAARKISGAAALIKSLKARNEQTAGNAGNMAEDVQTGNTAENIQTGNIAVDAQAGNTAEDVQASACILPLMETSEEISQAGSGVENAEMAAVEAAVEAAAVEVAALEAAAIDAATVEVAIEEAVEDEAVAAAEAAADETIAAEAAAVEIVAAETAVEETVAAETAADETIATEATAVETVTDETAIVEAAIEEADVEADIEETVEIAAQDFVETDAEHVIERDNLGKHVDSRQNIGTMRLERNDGVEKIDSIEIPDSIEKADSHTLLSIEDCINEAFRLKECGDSEGAILYYMYALDKKPDDGLVFWIILDICVLYKSLGQAELARDVLESVLAEYGNVMDSAVKAEIESNLY